MSITAHDCDWDYRELKRRQAVRSELPTGTQSPGEEEKAETAGSDRAD